MLVIGAGILVFGLVALLLNGSPNFLLIVGPVVAVIGYAWRLLSALERR